MKYGPHHHPLKAIDIAGTIAFAAVFAFTITVATLGALDLLTLPQLAWQLVLLLLPGIQFISVCEYTKEARPYLIFVTLVAYPAIYAINDVLSHFLFEGAGQSKDLLLRISCWVLIAGLPVLNAVISAFCTGVADLVLDGRILPWFRKKERGAEVE